MGTGVGGGVYVGGRTVHGLLHPEVGHMLLRPHPDDPNPRGVCPVSYTHLDGYQRQGEELPTRSGRQAEEPERETAGTDACVCPPETVAGENARGKPEAAPVHQGPCQPPPALCPAPQEETVHAGKPACETGEDAAEEPDFPFAPTPKAPPADRLRPLLWPRGFEALRPYFEKGIPCRLFDLPGWRFVNAAQAGGPDGLWAVSYTHLSTWRCASPAWG